MEKPQGCTTLKRDCRAEPSTARCYLRSGIPRTLVRTGQNPGGKINCLKHRREQGASSCCKMEKVIQAGWFSQRR